MITNMCDRIQMMTYREASCSFPSLCSDSELVSPLLKEKMDHLTTHLDELRINNEELST